MDEEADLFYFESDHVALKGNKDYCDLLKTIVVLESQKLQAIKDIDKLIELKNVAVKDPIDFIEKLKGDIDVGIPQRQIIPEVPHINWSKYGVPIPEEALKTITEGGNNTSISLKQNYQKIYKKSNDVNDSTSSRHNQPWTSEEQKKLEELLIKYPPEAIEARRFKKIAEELGNRTVMQVSSRVQKYFLKLYKAGLPIPGRIPKTVEKRRPLHKRPPPHRKHNYLLYKPSTFFPDSDVPVYMPEDDNDNQNSFIQHQSPPINNQQEQNNRLKISLLQKIKSEMRKANNLPATIHIGYKCDLCGEEPIKGCRWHCATCAISVDFCNDCLISQLNHSNPHPLSHNIVPLHNAEMPFEATNVITPIADSNATCTTMHHDDNSTDNSSSNEEEKSNGMSSDEEMEGKDFDKDYAAEMFANDNNYYNYLDPNFLPELHKS